MQVGRCDFPLLFYAGKIFFEKKLKKLSIFQMLKSFYSRTVSLMKKISKYLEDSQFIQWVFSPEEELNEWWNSFQTDNPREKENILLTRRIIHKLHTTDRELSENEKIILFAQILKQIEVRQESGKSRRIVTDFLKYAA